MMILQLIGQDCPHNTPLLMRCKNSRLVENDWTGKETAARSRCQMWERGLSD